jgi:ubiquinone/menaquinone biosynthesis C-methylase UbiE
VAFCDFTQLSLSLRNRQVARRRTVARRCYAASDNAASDNAASDNAASDNAASDNAASDNAASDNAASDNAASDSGPVSNDPSSFADPQSELMERAYAHWAPCYDALCGPIFLSGRRAAAAAARLVGGRIFEIGVGTGLSFDDYDASTEITGIDLSEPMIARARKRLLSGRYPFVKDLRVMDAAALAFAEETFDCVVAQFVITLVEHPKSVLSECARVLRPGGQIILVNHLYSERGVAAAIERLTARHARRLGLRPEFPFARLAAWAKEHGEAELIERRKLKPFGVYTLVRFRRTAPQSVAA